MNFNLKFFFYFIDQKFKKFPRRNISWTDGKENLASLNSPNSSITSDKNNKKYFALFNNGTYLSKHFSLLLSPQILGLS